MHLPQETIISTMLRVFVFMPSYAAHASVSEHFLTHIYIYIFFCVYLWAAIWIIPRPAAMTTWAKETPRRSMEDGFYVLWEPSITLSLCWAVAPPSYNRLAFLLLLLPSAFSSFLHPLPGYPISLSPPSPSLIAHSSSPSSVARCERWMFWAAVRWVFRRGTF